MAISHLYDTDQCERTLNVCAHSVFITVELLIETNRLY